MTIDSAKKRGGALVPPVPGGNIPLPDGTIDAADRGILVGVYSPDAMSSSGGTVSDDEIACYYIDCRRRRR